MYVVDKDCLLYVRDYAGVFVMCDDEANAHAAPVFLKRTFFR